MCRAWAMIFYHLNCFNKLDLMLELMARGGMRITTLALYPCFMIHNLWPTGWISHPLDHTP